MNMISRTSKKHARKGIKLPLWSIGLLVFSSLVFLISTSLWLYDKVQALASDIEVNSPSFGVVSEPSSGLNVPGIEGTTNDQRTPEAPVISTGALKPWSGTDRVTILAMGIDRRCDEVGPTRTDTMMILSMDPVSLSASVLSLPRDLWVEIPGFGVEKINQAHFLGEVYDYPGGGTTQLGYIRCWSHPREEL